MEKQATVELISYTGHGNPDHLYAARLLAYAKSTRLEQNEETRNRFATMSEEALKQELNYIANTIRSSWEFVDYTFQICNVTRAFTHQLVRTRTGSYAQQAQRVVDMNKFDVLIPQTVKDNGMTVAWQKLMTHISTVYGESQKAGVPNQDCRGVLPTNVMTNILAKFNLRTMADILAKRKNARAQGEYEGVARLMEAEVLRVHPWAEQFLNPNRLRTPALDKILRAQLGSAGPLDKPELNEALKELDKLKGTWG